MFLEMRGIESKYYNIIYIYCTIFETAKESLEESAAESIMISNISSFTSLIGLSNWK